MKLYVYNFDGETYETYEPFDDTYRKMKAECVAQGKPFSRQVINGEKIINEKYTCGAWIEE